MTEVTGQASPETAVEVPVTAPTEAPKEASAVAAPVVPTDKAVTEVPAYTPNFKYKAYDKEGEFDEFLRSVIKDKKTEEKIRDLYTRAEGLSEMKPRHEKTVGELARLRDEYNPIKQGIETLKQHVANKDFDAFFRDVNIPSEWVMQWVAQKLQYENLSPEDKKRYDDAIELRRQNSQLMKEREEFGTQAQNYQSQLKEFELNAILQAPETNQFMQEFDARQGKVGAFRQFVAQHAYATEMATGRDVSAKEAVDAVMALIGRPAAAPAAVQPAAQETQTQPKPVIPNIKSRGGSPVKKHAKTLDELRAYAQERIKEIQGQG